MTDAIRAPQETAHPGGLTPYVPPGVALAAADALRGGQETFTRSQVACLIALAFRLGQTTAVEGDLAELRTSWVDHRQDRATYEGRVTARLAEMQAGAEREARRPAAHGYRLECDWPPVAVPGGDGRVSRLPARHISRARDAA